MSNGNLLLSHRYFFPLTASEAAKEKLKHNSFYDMHLRFVLFREEVKWGLVSCLFLSSLSIRFLRLLLVFKNHSSMPEQ
jgi:hypothetical protein